MQDLQCSNYYR